MAMATNINALFFPILFSSKPPKQSLINIRSSPSLSIPNSKLPISSLRVSNNQRKARIFASSGLEEGNPSPNSSSLSKEVSFDLKLPRRSLIVQFTCNACGERTERTINKVAYERGTVFVQCAGCLVNHKLVDNLGLVVEYDLREDKDVDIDSPKEIDAEYDDNKSSSGSYSEK